MGRKTTKEKAMEKRKEKENKAGEIEFNWGKKNMIHIQRNNVV